MEDDEDLAMLPASNSATRAGSSGGDSQPLDSRGRVHSLHTELERHAQAPSSPRHRVGNLPHNRYNLLPDFKGGDGDDMDEHGDWHSLNSDFLLCDAAPECHFRFPLDRHTPTPARSEAGPFGRGGQGRLRRAAVLQQCALLVRDALVGCASFFRDDQESIVKYKRYRSWPMQLLLNTGAAIIMLLAFFERPNGSLGLLLPTYVTMPVEVACLLLFLMRLHQLRSISTESTFWRDRKNVLLLFCIAATFMDMVATVCTLALGLPNVRWSRVLRPVIMCTCCDFKEIRRGFRGIRKTLSSVFYVVVLLWMVIALFALLLLRLLDHKNLPSPRMAPYFTEWAQAFWDLYILMTSANFPNIMMPAYQSNRWYSLVFIVFIILSMYVFLSITLATVYNNYRENIKNEIKNNLQIRRINLKRVFELIAVDGFVYFEQWSALLAETHPQYGLDIVEILWNILDAKEMDKLDCSDFLHVADVLNLHVQRITSIRNMLSVWFPRLYFSAASILLQQAVRHRLFTIFFDLLITANAVTIALALNLADVYFLVIFNIEILLMIYTFSFMACAKSLTTAFDACVVITATISAIIDATQGISDSHRNFVNFILVLRVLCFIKVIRNIKRFRLIFDTLASLGPAVVPTAGMLLTGYYVYAIIGMEIWGGRIYVGNTDLPGSCYQPGTPFFLDIHSKNPDLENLDFADECYFYNNFNDIASSFVLLFELTVVNDWQVLANGFVQLTHKTARLYFLSFHVFIVMIILNVFVAFIIEAFTVQLDYCNNVFEDPLFLRAVVQLEKDRRSTGQVRFHIARKMKTIDFVYQRLFEPEVIQELDAEDLELREFVASARAGF